jgi:hypothetical protein
MRLRSPDNEKVGSQRLAASPLSGGNYASIFSAGTWLTETSLSGWGGRTRTLTCCFEKYLLRPHSQWCQTRGPAGDAGVTVRVRPQFENRTNPRPHRAADDARPCRRGHRMNRRDLIALLGSTAAACNECPRHHLARMDLFFSTRISIRSVSDECLSD